MKKVLLVILLLAPMAVMAQKFGHVNTQDIIQAMPDYTKARVKSTLCRSSMRQTSRVCRTS